MFLQETHSTKSVEKLWQNEWGYKIIFSHGSSNSRGVCILFKNNFDLEIQKCYSDDHGRFVIVDITAEGKKYTILNLYAPNEDNPEFFCSIFCALKDFECESLVIGGDFNCVLNPELDKAGGRPDTKVNTRNKLLKLMEDNNLVDIWRLFYPDTRQYTWRSTKAIIQCRLDYFLVSQSMTGYTNCVSILPGFKTDHSLIQLFLSKGNHPRGRGFFKLNTSFLKDLQFVNEIKTLISDTLIEN